MVHHTESYCIHTSKSNQVIFLGYILYILYSTFTFVVQPFLISKFVLQCAFVKPVKCHSCRFSWIMAQESIFSVSVHLRIYSNPVDLIVGQENERNGEILDKLTICILVLYIMMLCQQFGFNKYIHQKYFYYLNIQS